MRIASLQNEKIKAYAKLKEKKYRDIHQQFLVEEEHLVLEALKANAVRMIFHVAPLPFTYDVSCIEVTQQVIDKLSSNVSSVSMIAVCDMLKMPMDAPQRLLVLDGIQDPGNVGTLLRTAHAFGFDGVLLSPACADIYSEKCVRSSQGAIFHVACHKEQLVQALLRFKQQGMHIYSTGFQNAEKLQSVAHDTLPLALILGSEGQGVSQEVSAAADACLYIEMSQFDSLNVGVAGGILLYHFRKKV